MPDELDLFDLYKPGFYIDFAPGHYARVFDAQDYLRDERVAFKVMRLEHINKAEMKRECLAFGKEAKLLKMLADSENVVSLLDCGFVSGTSEIPNSGKIISFDGDVDAFSEALEEYNSRGWRPYLSEALMPEAHNMFLLLQESGWRKRRRMPTEEALSMCLQYAELLQEAHKQDIVYLDAKLEHFYWDGQTVVVIDWNSSKYLGDALYEDSDPEMEKRNDIKFFALGVMYSLFTGLPPQGDSHKAQPTFQDKIKDRYAGIDQLDFMIEPTLSPSLQDLMNAAGIWGDFTDVDQFVVELKSCAKEQGWPINGANPGRPSAAARQEILSGIEALRKAQADITHAKNCFMSAFEYDSDNREVQRLLKATDDFLDGRVIP